MSYQVLARKWRPKKFAELVGQEHVVSAITYALKHDRLHHAYLFSGTRGVGKTTIARIFSKSLNCEQGQGEDPCGVCDTCVAIEQGHYVDLLEIDAASKTKVEDTRELLDNVQYKPTRGRYKVYLIDEVHMLSKHSFNALLKTLEEPPPHVKFLLATTDPQKLPITILSRCLQFNLRAMSRDQITQQLNKVLEHESIPREDNAIAMLARAARGSMRDALSLTDQAIAQGNHQVSAQVVADMLGLMDSQWTIKIVHAIVEGDQQALASVVSQVDELCPDYQQMLSELSSVLHQIAMTQWLPDLCKLEASSAKAIYELSKALSGEHVQLLYRLALEGIKEFPMSVDGRTCFEMTLLRMVQFSPKVSVGLDSVSNTNKSVAPPIKQPINLPEHSEANETEDLNKQQAELETIKDTQVPSRQESDELLKTQQWLLAKEKLKSDSETGTLEKDRSNFPEVEQTLQNDSMVKSNNPSENFTGEKKNTLVDLRNLEPYTQSGEKLTLATQVDSWSQVIEQSGLDGLNKQIVLNASCHIASESITLTVSDQVAHLVNDNARNDINTALNGVFGEKRTLILEFGEPTQTPALIQSHIDDMRQKYAKELVHSDSSIQSLKQAFNAEIIEQSIEAR